MEIPVKTRNRHSPPSADLDSRRELTGTTKTVKGVGVKTDPSSSLGDRDQIVGDRRFTHVSSLNNS
jgi:hypothetical protein